MKALRVSLFILAIVVFAALMVAIGTQAEARTCGPRDGLVEDMKKIYGEVRRGYGIVGPEVIYEIWASDATGTWTILKTYSNGVACVVEVGEGWQDDPGELTPTGDPV